MVKLLSQGFIRFIQRVALAVAWICASGIALALESDDTFSSFHIPPEKADDVLTLFVVFVASLLVSYCCWVFTRNRRQMPTVMSRMLFVSACLHLLSICWANEVWFTFLLHCQETKTSITGPGDNGVMLCHVAFFILLAWIFKPRSVWVDPYDKSKPTTAQ